MSKLKDLLNSPALKDELAKLSSQENKNQQRNYLKQLIIQTSGAYEGDDPVWLILATDEVIDSWENHLDQAIICFEAILKERSLICVTLNYNSFI